MDLYYKKYKTPEHKNPLADKFTQVINVVYVEKY